MQNESHRWVVAQQFLSAINIASDIVSLIAIYSLQASHAAMIRCWSAHIWQVIINHAIIFAPFILIILMALWTDRHKASSSGASLKKMPRLTKLKRQIKYNNKLSSWNLISWKLIFRSWIAFKNLTKKHLH